MSDKKQHSANDDNKGNEHIDEGDIDQLIKRAGPRPHISAERRARVQQSIHHEWQAALQKNQQQKRRSVYLGIGISSASLSVIFLLFFLLPKTIEASKVEIAKVSMLKGKTFILQDEQKQAPLIIGTSILRGQSIQTEKESGIALSLKQNQSLRLDQNTQLIILAEDTFQLVQGAIYFDSGPGNQKPSHTSRKIKVHTDFGIVTDIGTQFEIRLKKNDMQINVREGEVNLNSDLIKNKRVEENNSLSVSPEGRLKHSAISPDSLQWSWALSLAPNFTLEGKSLDEYLIWLCREKGWSLRYADQSIAQNAMSNILHGSISGISMDDTLSAVAVISNINYTLRGRELSISPIKN